MSGQYPYLPALESMVKDVDKMPVRDLGVMEIPLDMIAGTKTAGRQNAFANNFMPLTETGSEFAMKWSSLYDSALEEGIRDPIKAYEYMNKFYVEEGNKRVSVSRFIGAVSVPAHVFRILPPKTEEPVSRIYYEYIDFYNVTGLFQITFSAEGSYGELAEHFGQDLVQIWPDEKIEELRTAFTIFNKCYSPKKAGKTEITAGDAFLLYIKVFGADSLLKDSENLIRHKIQRLGSEYRVIGSEDKIDLIRGPEEVGKGSSVKTLFTLGSAFTGKPIRAAFLFDRSEEDSSWVYSHELGANELVEKFEGAVEAVKFENCSTSKDLEHAFEACSADDEDIVFATSPAMMEACLKRAIE